MAISIKTIELVLMERIKYHDRLYNMFKEEGKELETAVQYNLREECQNIAKNILGYYL